MGLVDAAWTRKKEKTEAITSLDDEKRAQLRKLAAQFAEALKEVE